MLCISFLRDSMRMMLRMMIKLWMWRIGGTIMVRVRDRIGIKLGSSM
jgi:hypothetical protein